MLAVERSFVLPAHEFATVVVVPVAENKSSDCAVGAIRLTSRSCKKVCEALKLTATLVIEPVSPVTVKVTSRMVVEAFWHTGLATFESGIAPNDGALAGNVAVGASATELLADVDADPASTDVG